MMREQKTHWRKFKGTYSVWQYTVSMCGQVNPTYANAKRKVTCKNCLRAMGVK